jgi:putative ABC transport system permease protein
MQTLRADLRLAFRLLAKKPGFTVVAVLTLALGIAVNATMFSLVSAFLLRRPPVHDPDRIVVVSSVNPNPVFNPDASSISAPNYLAWREASHAFADTAAADEYRTVNLTPALNQAEGSARASVAAEPEGLVRRRWRLIISMSSVCLRSWAVPHGWRGPTGTQPRGGSEP